MTEPRCSCMWDSTRTRGFVLREVNPKCPVHGGEPPVAEGVRAEDLEVRVERSGDLGSGLSGSPRVTATITHLPTQTVASATEKSELRAKDSAFQKLHSLLYPEQPPSEQRESAVEFAVRRTRYQDSEQPVEQERWVLVWEPAFNLIQAGGPILKPGERVEVVRAEWLVAAISEGRRLRTDRDEAWREILRLKKALEDKGDVADFDVEALRAERDEARKEVERLRARTHEIQEAADKRNASLQKAVDNYRNAFARAREMVKHVKADWTTDPPSQGDYGFWRYTSKNTTDTLAYMASQIIEAEQSRDQLREALREAVECMDRIPHSQRDNGFRAFMESAAAREALGEKD